MPDHRALHHYAGLNFLAAIEHDSSSGLIESTRTMIWLIARMAFGF